MVERVRRTRQSANSTTTDHRGRRAARAAHLYLLPFAGPGNATITWRNRSLLQVVVAAGVTLGAREPVPAVVALRARAVVRTERAVRDALRLALDLGLGVLWMCATGFWLAGAAAAGASTSAPAASAAASRRRMKVLLTWFSPRSYGPPARCVLANRSGSTDQLAQSVLARTIRPRWPCASVERRASRARAWPGPGGRWSPGAPPELHEPTVSRGAGPAGRPNALSSAPANCPVPVRPPASAAGEPARSQSDRRARPRRRCGGPGRSRV